MKKRLHTNETLRADDPRFLGKQGVSSSSPIAPDVHHYWTQSLRIWLRSNKFPIFAFCLWFAIQQLIAVVSRDWWHLQFNYLGSVPWSNFDGVHYLTIATGGYQQYQQAFFPFYPVLIGIIGAVARINPAVVALGISYCAFFFGLIFLYQYARVASELIARWSVIWTLGFSMSFFFAAAYSESVFFLLIILFMTLTRKQQWFFASFVVALATATRLVGVFLIPILIWYMYQRKTKISHMLTLIVLAFSGLALYMGYLYVTTSDPLAFVHVQPFFGANRSGGDVVLLPQVIWRYIKIFTTASPQTLQYWVSFIEFFSLLLTCWIIIKSWKNKELKPLLVYSICCIVLPSLSGTLSSLPRYVLSAPPLFLAMAHLSRNWSTKIALSISVIVLVIATSLFLAGYFVS